MTGWSLVWIWWLGISNYLNTSAKPWAKKSFVCKRFRLFVRKLSDWRFDFFRFGGTPNLMPYFANPGATGAAWHGSSQNAPNSYSTSSASYGTPSSQNPSHTKRAGSRSGSSASNPLHFSSNYSQGPTNLLQGNPTAPQAASANRTFVETLASLPQDKKDENCSICIFELTDAG